MHLATCRELLNVGSGQDWLPSIASTFQLQVCGMHVKTMAKGACSSLVWPLKLSAFDPVVMEHYNFISYPDPPTLASLQGHQARSVGRLYSTPMIHPAFGLICLLGPSAYAWLSGSKPAICLGPAYRTTF